MADQLPVSTMSYSFQVAYDGRDAGDTMDVQLLAPALLALGELVKEANATINGSRSSVNLLVRSDFEHKCFNINLDLVQSIYEQVRGLLKSDTIETATDILTKLGLLGMTPAGLLVYLRTRRGRRARNVTKLESADKRGVVSVEIGDGATVDRIEVHNHVYSLGENPKALRAVSNLLKPLETRDYDKIEFRRDDVKVAEVTKAEAEDIQKTCALAALPGETDDDPQPVTAVLEVLGPVFDPDAKYWRFWYGEQPIQADISGTDIAREAIARGGVAVGDTYRVRMVITQSPTANQRHRNQYTITEVLDFQQAPRAVSLFSSPPIAEDE